MRRLSLTTVLAALVVAHAAALLAAAPAAIPARPEQLTFPDLSFAVPDAAKLRYELGNGIAVYAKQDRELPLVNLQVLFKGGRYLEPAGKAGLASVASEVWRTGGAGERDAKQLDEELDYLAADLSTRVGDVTGSVSLNVLAKDLERALPILMDVLLRPRFQDDRFAKAKDDLVQDLKTRNDNSARLEAREWDRLLFGDAYWMNQLPTKASVEGLAADDCKAFVTSLIKADNVILAVSGDFDAAALRTLLDRSFGSLPKLAAALPAVPQPTHRPAPGVYLVDKPDVNQGRVRIGQVGYREGHPTQFDLMMLNDILGGGSFTSRITKKVRSDEGLAYSAYSNIDFPLSVPGTFEASFQTKSSTCAYATEITVGLIKQVREEAVSQEEIDVARASFIETFPRTFESSARTVGLFATGELLGRDKGYWATYRDRIAAVTADGILAAAKKDLDPASMVVLVVGNAEEILAGHPEHSAKMTDFGPLHRIPLRDPLTLEPLAEN